MSVGEPSERPICVTMFKVLLKVVMQCNGMLSVKSCHVISVGKFIGYMFKTCLIALNICCGCLHIIWNTDGFKDTDIREELLKLNFVCGATFLIRCLKKALLAFLNFVCCKIYLSYL